MIRNRYDLLLGAVATFEIRVGNRTLYKEEMFPIVELAVALKRWMGLNMPNQQLFEFRSMESDESGLVWIRPEDSGWRIGSIHQEFPDVSIRSGADVQKIVRKFVDDVAVWVSKSADVEWDELLYDQ